jgi:hypothetical protein
MAAGDNALSHSAVLENSADRRGARAVQTAPEGPARHLVEGASLQPARAGFLAERSEALQARFQPPVSLAHSCPLYFGKLH